MKHCGGCNKDKPIESFGKDKHRSDGLTSQCKLCRNKRCSEYRKEHPDFIKHLNKMSVARRKEYYADPVRKRKYKNLELKRTYNITIEKYENLFQKQNGLCAICFKPELSPKNSYMAVDHDHSCCSGQKSCGKCVRKLLCNFCNRALGLFCDDISIVEKALIYLKEHKDAYITNIA